MRRTRKLIFVSLWMVLSSTFCFSQTVKEILEKVDEYRRIGDSFIMRIKISDFSSNNLVEEADFEGYFSDNDKSLIVCKSGKDEGMKILMKSTDMWVSLLGSKRALRITPMQRLMGQASIGDVAKIGFSKDYSGEIIDKDNNGIKLFLKAIGKGATYQKIILYVKSTNYEPIKAEFFLLSGKHFKTAYYEEYIKIEERTVNNKIKIEDELKKGSYSIMVYSGYKRTKLPDKYFNVMFLPQAELDFGLMK